MRRKDVPGRPAPQGPAAGASKIPFVPVVYLLRCADDSLYCGWTVDLDRRVRDHQAGKGSRYTRSRLPVEVALVLEQPDATTARREEARIKRLTRREKLALLAAS